MLKKVFLGVISLINLSGCQEIDKENNGVYVMSTEKKYAFHVNNEAEYQSFIKKVVQKFDENQLSESDLLLGNLDYFYHKSPNYKKDKASYDHINYDNKLKINLSKDRNSNYWKYLSLKNKDNGLNFLPSITDRLFFKKLNLEKKEVKYDKEYGTYNYIYFYKNRIQVEFIVDEEYFNNKEYPENYRAINMWRL